MTTTEQEIIRARVHIQVMSTTLAAYLQGSGGSLPLDLPHELRASMAFVVDALADCWDEAEKAIQPLKETERGCP